MIRKYDPNTMARLPIPIPMAVFFVNILILSLYHI